jgi:hypothetical protein
MLMNLCFSNKPKFEPTPRKSPSWEAKYSEADKAIPRL